jgi:hypothetical protein
LHECCGCRLSGETAAPRSRAFARSRTLQKFEPSPCAGRKTKRKCQRCSFGQLLCCCWLVSFSAGVGRSTQSAWPRCVYCKLLKSGSMPTPTRTRERFRDGMYRECMKVSDLRMGRRICQAARSKIEERDTHWFPGPRSSGELPWITRHVIVPRISQSPSLFPFRLELFISIRTGRAAGHPTSTTNCSRCCLLRGRRGELQAPWGAVCVKDE